MQTYRIVSVDSCCWYWLVLRWLRSQRRRDFDLLRIHDVNRFLNAPAKNTAATVSCNVHCSVCIVYKMRNQVIATPLENVH